MYSLDRGHALAVKILEEASGQAAKSNGLRKSHPYMDAAELREMQQSAKKDYPGSKSTPAVGAPLVKGFPAFIAPDAKWHGPRKVFSGPVILRYGASDSDGRILKEGMEEKGGQVGSKHRLRLLGKGRSVQRVSRRLQRADSPVDG